MGEHLASEGHGGSAGVLFNEVGGSGCTALNTSGGVGGAAGVESVCLWVLAAEVTAGCMLGEGRRREVDGAVSLGGLIRSLFIGPQPQRSVCLSACMMEGIKS